MTTEHPEGTTAALLRMAESMRQQTDAFTKAMGAQTQQISTLTEKVEQMNTRIIRLEEQRHGRDIQKLTDDVSAISGRVTALEMLRAKGEGIHWFMNWVRVFAPWIVAGGIFTLVALGFERSPKQ